jgi:hypothetical protein
MDHFSNGSDFPNEEPETNTSKIPLLNYAALKVFEQGGKVFLENKEDLPDSSSKINALFRY